ncbi:MAG: hypothetical protein HC921_07060 [Synechococcaceae cyanobacterium SM2_3_1]|nr:hypothetical protein [Synechococcaceae cyanobacterium SM2_3_1]
MITPTMPRSSTTEMEVTSIRLERELKDKLKQLAGNQGYQTLVREVLWTYVHQQLQPQRSKVTRQNIRASVPATAQQEEYCALTGEVIAPAQSMLLGLTQEGHWVPLSCASLAAKKSAAK